jgi:hypothetical protein
VKNQPSPPWGRGWPATAPSSAGAGRVRGARPGSIASSHEVFTQGPEELKLSSPSTDGQGHGLCARRTDHAPNNGPRPRRGRIEGRTAEQEAESSRRKAESADLCFRSERLLSPGQTAGNPANTCARGDPAEGSGLKGEGSPGARMKIFEEFENHSRRIS